MLCSVSGDKPTGSTWLDRLRSSRGYSISEEDDDGDAHLSIDHFLRRNHHRDLAGDPPTNEASEDSPSVITPSNRELTESPREEDDDKDGGDGEWYGVMSDVLSELFNFGATTRSSRISRKKFPRKQANPRHCSVEAPANVPVMGQRDPNCLPGVREFATSSLNLDNMKPAPETRERRRSILEPGGVEEEEKGVRDLVGYSRSEVTVIDTSFEIWKSEKLVFRRKNVWKVRDKKGISRIISAKKKKKKKKKKKCSVGVDEIGVKNKKMKISCPIPDNNPQSHGEDDYRDPANDSNPVTESRLPTKSRKEGSWGAATSRRNEEPEGGSYNNLIARKPDRTSKPKDNAV